MRNIVNMIYVLILGILLIGCGQSKKNENVSISKNETVVVNEDPDCVEFVALWASGDIAEKIGKDRKWVFLNYTVQLWDQPPMQGEGNVVGMLRASSYARIIEKRGDDYKVESPINQVHGWINNEHVKAISKKNPKTKALCE
mgnify:CR=1 FL=1